MKINLNQQEEWQPFTFLHLLISDLAEARQSCISASVINARYAVLVEVYEQKPRLTQACLVEKGRYFNGFLKKTVHVLL